MRGVHGLLWLIALDLGYGVACCVMIYCFVLFYGVLWCCIVLCYDVFCVVIWRCNVLCHDEFCVVIWCCIVLYCVMMSGLMWRVVCGATAMCVQMYLRV